MPVVMITIFLLDSASVKLSKNIYFKLTSVMLLDINIAHYNAQGLYVISYEP